MKKRIVRRKEEKRDDVGGNRCGQIISDTDNCSLRIFTNVLQQKN